MTPQTDSIIQTQRSILPLTHTAYIAEMCHLQDSLCKFIISLNAHITLLLGRGCFYPVSLTKEGRNKGKASPSTMEVKPRPEPTLLCNHARMHARMRTHTHTHTPCSTSRLKEKGAGIISRTNRHRTGRMGWGGHCRGPEGLPFCTGTLSLEKGRSSPCGSIYLRRRVELVL